MDKRLYSECDAYWCSYETDMQNKNNSIRTSFVLVFFFVSIGKNYIVRTYYGEQIGHGIVITTYNI